MDAIHSIEMASRLTGLSQNLIRAWEQRYAAVEPKRSPTKRRLYSQAEIERLKLLKELTSAGHSIGHIAKLPDPQLRELGNAELKPIAQAVPKAVESAEAWLNEAILAIRALDGLRLERALKSAAAVLGTNGVLQTVIAPLAGTIGQLWREGRITAAHEHFGTGLIRDFLREISKPFSGSETGPMLVIATPAGQLHEMGALMAGAMAANLGWRVTQLGASLPAAEIAAAARQKSARAVALSLVYPEDDPGMARELELLREFLPNECALIAGGRALGGYRDVLLRSGALLAENLADFGVVLDDLRRGRD